MMGIIVQEWRLLQYISNFMWRIGIGELCCVANPSAKTPTKMDTAHLASGMSPKLETCHPKCVPNRHFVAPSQRQHGMATPPRPASSRGWMMTMPGASAAELGCGYLESPNPSKSDVFFFQKPCLVFSLWSLQAEMRMVKIGEAASVTTGSPLRFEAVNI
jgi:hypothetical protein